MFAENGTFLLLRCVPLTNLISPGSGIRDSFTEEGRYKVSGQSDRGFMLTDLVMSQWLTAFFSLLLLL